METQPTRDDLVALVVRILESDGTEQEIDALIGQLEAAVPHPAATDVLFHSDEDLSPDQIVDKLLSYEPIRL